MPQQIICGMDTGDELRLLIVYYYQLWTHYKVVCSTHCVIVFFFFFLMWTILKSLLNFLQYCFCFIFCFFGSSEAGGIWTPPPGIKHTPAALEDLIGSLSHCITREVPKPLYLYNGRLKQRSALCAAIERTSHRTHLRQTQAAPGEHLVGYFKVLWWGRP